MSKDNMDNREELNENDNLFNYDKEVNDVDKEVNDVDKDEIDYLNMDLEEMEKLEEEKFKNKLVNDIEERIERERREAVLEYKENLRIEQEKERYRVEEDKRREKELAERALVVAKMINKDENSKVSDEVNSDEKINRTDRNNKNIVKKKNKKWVAFGSIASLLLIGSGVYFSFFTDDEKKDNVPVEVIDSSKGIENETETETDKVLEETIDDKEVSIEVPEDTNKEEVYINRSSVYESDVTGENKLFKLGLISEEGLSVPITLLVTKDKLLSDFGTSEVSQFDLYSRYGSSLSEEVLGGVDYHPYKGVLSVDEETKTLTFRFDEESQDLYDKGTASSQIFKNSLVDTFGDFYDRVKFETAEGDYYYFSHEGEGSEILEMDENINNYAYYKYTLANGNEFIGANFGKVYKNVTDALLVMKKTDNDFYDSLVPEGVDYTVNEYVGSVEVIFKDELDLSKYSNKEVLSLIEGLNLTANGFDKSLKLENVLQKKWQGFDLTKEIERTVGANKVKLN